MKSFFFILMLQVCAICAFSQKQDSLLLQQRASVDLSTERKVYKGYTISLKAGKTKSYEFDILKDNDHVRRQFNNPVPFFPNGIQKTEDAYKIAQWIISEYQKTGHWQNMVPPHVVRQLGIDSK